MVDEWCCQLHELAPRAQLNTEFWGLEPVWSLAWYDRHIRMNETA